MKMRKVLWMISAIAAIILAIGIGKTAARADVGDDLFAAATWSQGTNYGTVNPSPASRKWAVIPAEAGATYTIIAKKTDWRAYVYPATADDILDSSNYVSVVPGGNGAAVDITAPAGTTEFRVTVYPNPDVTITDELWETFCLQMIKSESPEKETGDLFADAVWNIGSNYGSVNPIANRRYAIIPCETGDTYKFKARSNHWHMYIYPATADGILDSNFWTGFAPTAAGDELVYDVAAFGTTEPTELRITAYHDSPDVNPLSDAFWKTFDMQMFKVETAAPTRTVTTHKADGTTETHEYELWDSTTSLPAPTGEGYEKYYYLNDDVTVSTQGVFTASNQKLYIDLNGHTVKSVADRFYYFGNTGADQPVTLVMANGTIEWAGTPMKNGWGYGFYLNTQNSTAIFDNITFKNGKTEGGTNDYTGFVHLNCATVSAHFFDTDFDNCDGIGGSAISVSAGTAVFNSGEIKGCNATKMSGAIYVNGGTFTMNGGSIYKNAASADRGGAVMCNGGKVNIGGTALIGGSAANANTVTSSYGAGVHMAGGTFTMTGGEISYHTAMYAGANLSLFNAVGNISGGKITNGTLTSASGAHGGANICVYDGAQLTLEGSAIVSDGVNNGSSTFGGNIFARSLNDRSSNVTVKGSAQVLNGQVANGKGGNIAAKTQGGSKHETITIEGNAVIDGGTAKEGGNISFESTGSTFIIKDQAKVSNGESTTCGGNVNFAAAGTIRIEGGTIENGTAATHSGNLRGNGSTFTMSGGMIMGGQTNSTHGGNMTLSGTFTMTGGEITDGTSASHSGNVYHDGTTFTMSGGTISGGTATTYAGNVYIAKAAITISGTAVITGGTAGTYGGNVVIPGGNATFTMNGGEISDGTALTLHGGNMTCGGTFTMTGGTITGGKAEASRAGNIYIAKSFTMSGGTISNGKAKYGGNIVIESASIAMNISGTAVISGGEATTMEKNPETGAVISGYGGNIDTAGPITLKDSAVISGGKAAAYGGNIAFRGANELLIQDNATIIGGTANSNGGNITIAGAGTLKLSGDAVISGGVAETSHGGNIANNSTGSIIVTGGTIANGTAPSGANIYLMNGTADLSNGAVIGGTATDGSSIYLKTGALTMSDVTMNGGLVTADGTLNVTDSMILDAKFNGGTISVTNSDFGNVELGENAAVYFDVLELKQGSALEKFLDGGYYKVEPSAAWIADGCQVFEGTFMKGEEKYNYAVVSAEDLPSFVPVISGTIAEKFGLVLQVNPGHLEGAEAPFIRITRKGVSVDITDYTVEDGKYIFLIEVDPEELGDDLSPSLMLGETVLEARPGYAVVTYVKALAESDQATNDLKTLLADLLEYGAAAQMYFNYKTDALANAAANRWTGYAPSTYTAPATVPDMAYESGSQTVTILGANLWLEDDTVAVQFKGLAPDDATFTLNDQTATATFENGGFVLRTAALKMSEVTDAVFTAKVEKDGTSSSVTYGVANYIVRITANNGNANMKALAERLWAYCTSAKAYH